MAGSIDFASLASLVRWWFVARSLTPPKVLSSDETDHTTLLEVSGKRFWWPNEYSQVLLERVYAEVFLPFPPNAHAYETGACQLISGTVVLDAGACEGFFSLYALERGCTVIAIEPVPRLCECLKKTFYREIQGGTFSVLNLALADSNTGETRLAFEGSPIAAQTSATGGLRVDVASIDVLRATGCVPKIAFIKMDIEGSERAALLGAVDTIKADLPALSLAAYHRVGDADNFSATLDRVGQSYARWTKGVARLRTQFVPKMFHAVPRRSG